MTSKKSTIENHPTHPSDALFQEEPTFPVLPVCEHIAGNEKLITKAFQIQRSLGPVFDITCDCEDGAPAGQEIAHARMVARLIAGPINHHGMAGARIHDFGHPAWREEVKILMTEAGDRIRYLTIPKPTSAAQVARMAEFVDLCAERAGIGKTPPLHVLIETHGALREVWRIAAVPGVQVIDFGLMDFVSDHHGAIPVACMRSPGQFEHQLLRRAKSEIAAAALANGCIPAHKVTLDLRNYQQTFDDAFRARREFGFLRMWSVHPTQIEAIVAAMAPDNAEVEAACEILLAAQGRAWGPIQHNGELHDRASYRYYWQVLQKARASGIPIPGAALQRFF